MLYVNHIKHCLSEIQIWHTPFVSQASPRKESIQALTQLDGSLDPQNNKAAPRNEEVPKFELAIKHMVSKLFIHTLPIN